MRRFEHAVTVEHRVGDLSALGSLVWSRVEDGGPPVVSRPMACIPWFGMWLAVPWPRVALRPTPWSSWYGTPRLPRASRGRLGYEGEEMERTSSSSRTSRFPYLSVLVFRTIS